MGRILLNYTANLLGLLMLVTSFQSSASLTRQQEAVNKNQWQQWPLVGEAQLSWFFFDIYQSRLTTPNGYYQLSDDVTPHPLALTIEYQRDISAEQLIEATQDQWTKLGVSKGEQGSWIATMKAIYPNIREGDKLAYVTDGQVGSFYHSSKFFSNRLIGRVENENLNDAFLAIWLAPNSEYRDLRDQLVGVK
ncbi:chalcone isomerase family protein [Vibrio maerlii]|uniref:chalcone isomerase family protein n=1 Tax=Vibrio maerlii TaxID=2231648 RepID=UPI000E3B7599|nr:chalcone isomerase family protein [Vibrio maerlii]